MAASRRATSRPVNSDQEMGAETLTGLFPLSNILDQPSMSVSAVVPSAPEGVRLRLVLDPELLERSLGGEIEEPTAVPPPLTEVASADVGPTPEPTGNLSSAALEERRLRVKAARGSMKHVPGSVDEFLREKHRETDQEEARWERHRKR